MSARQYLPDEGYASDLWTAPSSGICRQAVAGPAPVPSSDAAGSRNLGVDLVRDDASFDCTHVEWMSDRR